jgi:hypothetical protein
VGYTVRLINEYTNNWLVLGAGYFGVNQLEAMIDCHPFSQSLNPCCNRFVSHAILAVLAPKEKVGAKPTGQDPVPSSKL